MENFCLLIDQGNKGYSGKLISTCIPYLKNQRGESSYCERKKGVWNQIFKGYVFSCVAHHLIIFQITHFTLQFCMQLEIFFPQQCRLRKSRLEHLLQL